MAISDNAKNKKNEEEAAEMATSTGGTSQAMNIFAQNLLIEKGGYKLEAQTADIMKQELVERLELLVNKVSIGALSESQLKQFNTLLDEKADAQDLQVFISDNVPDLKQRLTEAFYRFRLVYLGAQ